MSARHGTVGGSERRPGAAGARPGGGAQPRGHAHTVEVSAEPRGDAWWGGVRDALACSQAMVVAVDTRGRIRAAGPMVARRLADTDVDGLLGRVASRFVVPAERARAEEALGAVLEGRVWRGALRLVSVRGVERLLKLRVSPLSASGGALRGGLVELDPRASGDGISRERLDAQSRMAGGMAHNFNNLLTVIRGGTYMLARELPNLSPLQLYVREIEEAVERAAAWARQLGAIGRTIIFRPVALDPNELCREAMEFLVTLAPPGVETHVALAPGVSRISVDPARFGQALRALVRNALDAVGEEGEITVGLEEEEVRAERGGPLDPIAPGHYVTFFVRDDGHGIDPSIAGQVLEPYFTTRGPTRGVGLGLPTALAIARASGGGLEIQSSVGQGTEVRLLVPRADDEARVAPAQNGARGPDLRADGSRAVVLIVEDDPAVLRTVQASLQRAGMRAVAAPGAQQARRLLAEPSLHFDAAIFDVVLPDGRGDDLARETRERLPELPIVLTSGFVASKPLSFRSDVHTAFLRKPFSPADLTGTLLDLLASS